MLNSLSFLIQQIDCYCSLWDQFRSHQPRWRNCCFVKEIPTKCMCICRRYGRVHQKYLLFFWNPKMAQLLTGLFCNECILLPNHWIVLPISNLRFFLTNICYGFFFSCQTEKNKSCFGPIRSLFSFSIAQNKKNSWTKLGKQIGEKI